MKRNYALGKIHLTNATELNKIIQWKGRPLQNQDLLICKILKANDYEQLKNY
jgi:hypothetical protein